MTGPASRLAAIVVVCLAAVTTAPAAGDTDGAAGTGATGEATGALLIVHAPHLRPAAERWARYRAARGWRVRLHAAGAAAGRPVRPSSLLAVIRADYRRRGGIAGGAPYAVLLLGDGDAGGIPAWRFRQRDPDLTTRLDPGYVTDHPYQLMDDADELPDVALGRVPARTVDEALVLLEKIRGYEQRAPAGPWRRRIVYAAGEGHFGAADVLLEWLFKEMVDRLVPDVFDVSVTYAKPTSIYCPPPSQLTDVVLRRLGEGALLFNYVGHGQATRLDALRWGGRRIDILTVGDLARLRGTPDQLPIALLSCCSAGWFDLDDGRTSLAEGMLLHPTGPVAVIAGSRLTHPYANAVLQKDLTRLLLVERVATVGELDRLAARSMLQIDRGDRELDLLARPIARLGGWASSLTVLRRMHVRLYNLLGDPTTRIALPTDRPIVLALRGDELQGRVPGMVTGRVAIRIETRRPGLADPVSIVPVHGDDDAALEDKAANNYALANDRTLRRHTGRVEEERFTIVLDTPLPPSARIVKAEASGWDADGRPLEALGAVRLGEGTEGAGGAEGEGR